MAGGQGHRLGAQGGTRHWTRRGSARSRGTFPGRARRQLARPGPPAWLTLTLSPLPHPRAEPGGPERETGPQRSSVPIPAPSGWPSCCLLTDPPRTLPAKPLHFRSSPLGAAELPKCCAAALFQTQTSTSRAQPLPHSSISASSALSGVPSSPSPHTPPRSQGGPSFHVGGQRLAIPFPKTFCFVIRRVPTMAPHTWVSLAPT